MYCAIPGLASEAICYLSATIHCASGKHRLKLSALSLPLFATTTMFNSVAVGFCETDSPKISSHRNQEKGAFPS